MPPIHGMRERPVRRRRMPMNRLAQTAARASLSVALSALLVTPLAHADPPASAETYEASLVRAVAAKERALDDDDDAHWRDALRLFRAADAIRSTPEARYEIGHAAQRLGQVDLAFEAYEAALELGLDGPARDKASEFVAAHTNDVARIVVTGPAGATLTVNGAPRATLPAARPIVVSTGVVTLELSTGDARASRTLELAPGARETVDLSPAQPRPAPPSETPSLAPSSPEPRDLAVAPARPHATVGRGATPGAWVLIGSGAAFVVAGAILIPIANGRIDDARNGLNQSCQYRNGLDGCFTANPGSQQTAQDQVDAIATYKAVRTGAWLGLGAGGIALITGIALEVHSPAARPEPSARSAERGWTLDLAPRRGGSVVAVQHAF